MESRIDHRLSEHDRRIKELSGKVESFLKTSLPPRKGILFEGQIFDAHVFVSNLIKHADKHIILIDKYIDKTVLALMDKRKRGVTATIYTKRIDSRLLLGLERHNDQYPTPVNVRTATNVHDRFMVIDDTLYHIGASIKDLGKKFFAFSRMEGLPRRYPSQPLNAQSGIKRHCPTRSGNILRALAPRDVGKGARD